MPSTTSLPLSELVDRFDNELRTDAYADLDASANGLQVGPTAPYGFESAAGSDSESDAEPDPQLEHIAFAVDGVRQTFDAAAEAGADALVTHHGISWGGIEHITGRTYSRLEPLFTHDLALYVSHLPLDGHQELGNAAGVGDVLGLESREPFGEYGPEYVGQQGTLSEPVEPTALVDTLESALDTGGRSVRLLEFGPPEIERVAIVTGSGVDWLDDAVAAGADVLITGEGKQNVYHEAREAGIHVVLAGHYATETFGVRSLQERVEEWGLETTFVDVPTGL